MLIKNELFLRFLNFNYYIKNEILFKNFYNIINLYLNK